MYDIGELSEDVYELVDNGPPFHDLQELHLDALTVEFREFLPVPEGTGSKCSNVSIDAYCGDDLIVVCESSEYAFIRLASIKSLDMKISMDDTSINCGVGNYTESIVRVPRTYHDTWLSYRKIQNRSTFCYVDVPKLRLCLSVKSERLKYSDTILGKNRDLGSMTSWIPESNPSFATFHVSNLFQDCCLGSMNCKASPYIPSCFSGGGKPLLFSEISNVVRFHKTFKTGRYLPVLHTLCRDTVDILSSYSKGEYYEPTELVQYCCTSDPVFNDWLKGEDVFTRIVSRPLPQWCSDFFIGRFKANSVTRPGLSRLISEGLLVTETKLKIAIDHNLRTSALLAEEEYPDFVMKLEEIKQEWRSISATSQDCLEKFGAVLLQGPPSNLLVKEFLDYVGSFRDLRRVLREEDVFLSKCLDSVYLSGPMMVHTGMYLKPRGKFFTPNYVERDGFDDASYPGDLDKLYDWVMEQNGPMPRDLIDDDFIIDKEISGNSIVVTDDVRLCRHLHKKFGYEILRFPVEFYYRITYFGDGDIHRACGSRFESWNIELDTGSIQSGEEYYFLDGVMFPEGARNSKIVYTQPWNTKFLRPEGNELNFDEVEIPPVGWPSRFLFSSYQTNKFDRRVRRLVRYDF